MQIETTLPAAQQPPPPRIAAPRAPWMVALLTFATFGLYPCFWLYGRARDARALGRAGTWPWLWFLAPLAAISLPFAIPNLLGFHAERLRASGSADGSGTGAANGAGQASEDATMAAHPGAAPGAEGADAIPAPRPDTVAVPDRHAAAIGFGLFLVVAMINLVDRLGGPIWAVAIGVAALAAGSGLLQARINEVTPAAPGVTWRGRRNRYHPVEWIVLIPGLAASALTWGLVLLEAGQRIAAPVVDGSVRVPGAGIEIPFDAPGWHELDATGATGESGARYLGPRDGQSLDVFRHAGGTSVDELVDQHIAAARENIPGAECRERRALVDPRRLVLSVRVRCRGTTLGERVLTLVHLFEDADGLTEVVARLGTPPNAFTAESRALERLMDGIRPTEIAP